MKPRPANNPKACLSVRLFLPCGNEGFCGSWPQAGTIVVRGDCMPKKAEPGQGHFELWQVKLSPSIVILPPDWPGLFTG